MKLNLLYSIWRWHILQRDELSIANLKEYFSSDKPAYLYFILCKNRISINHESISFTDNYIKTEFLIHNKGQLIKEELNFKHTYVDLKEVKVISDFPYNKFKIVDELGDALIQGKAAYFPEHEEVYSQVKNKDLLDYEILYIGQSVLAKNNVPVLKRVTAHQTFQKILEDYSTSHPDKELFCFFFSFKQSIAVDVPEKVIVNERVNFIQRFKDTYFINNIENKRQNVNLLEAILINYFKPIYNSDFVKKPPSESHMGFKSINQMNLNKVNVLIGMEDFLPKIYSSAVKKNSEYRIEYLFDNDNL